MSAAVRLYAVATILALVHCNVHHELVSLNQIKSTEAPFKACIDDSDCSSQGNGYACFQYICYPWEDDSAVAKEDRKATCKSNEQCGSDLVCFRHHDRRNIHKGLCMEEIKDCSENGKSDCKHGPNRSCCNGQYCCGQEYFDQLKQLPCVNDQGCKDMGYGNFCCPDKSGGNETLPSTCCNEDPNPPPPTTTTTTTTTTQRPPRAEKVNGSSSLSSSVLPALLLLFIVSLRQ